MNVVMDLETTYALREWFKRSMTKHVGKFGFCWTGVGCWNWQSQSLEEAGGSCIWSGPAPMLQVSVFCPVRPPLGTRLLGLSNRRGTWYFSQNFCTLQIIRVYGLSLFFVYFVFMVDLTPPPPFSPQIQWNKSNSVHVSRKALLSVSALLKILYWKNNYVFTLTVFTFCTLYQYFMVHLLEILKEREKSFFWRF